MADTDVEGNPIPKRCDSSLSVIKIARATRNKKSSVPFVAQKFSDPEIESLYHLHSIHRKKTELFQTFLYAVLLYTLIQLTLKAYWISQAKSTDLSEPDQQEFLAARYEDHAKRIYREASFVNFLETRNGTLKQQRLDALIPNRLVGNVNIKSTAGFESANIHSDLHSAKQLRNAHDKSTWRLQQMILDNKNCSISNCDHSLKMSRMKREGASNGEEEVNPSISPFGVPFASTSFVLLTVTIIWVIHMLLSIGPFKENPHIPAILWLITILIPIAVRGDTTLPLRVGLDWVVVENFLIWMTLPIRLKTAVTYSSILVISHTGVVLWKGKGQDDLGHQVGANLIILLTTNLLGMLSFYLDDKKQRRAFLDTRQSMEMKLVIEEQAKEQEQLLLSVLPEHLAIKMRQDMGATVDGQFKTVYMSRHENVSILFADIVGFTQISSTYSASELVKILNELFARFDKLAEKYHQIRIKILGDCYYCICGAPEERKDHAVLSVHMGLSMVSAIKYVRETTKSPVDMRVGVHTGAILAGVLGQRQWQFDVYSKDVELANKMESSGMPGRVHISETTLKYMNGEFEVEPAHGEKREEILRIAGLKTYFIVKILKPFLDSSSNKLCQNDEIEKDTPTVGEESSAVEDNAAGRKDSDIASYHTRLKEELISRDGYRDLSTQSEWFGLRFRNKLMEAQFIAHKEPYAGISSISSPIAMSAFSLASFAIISFNLLSFVTSVCGVFVLLLISVLLASESSFVKAHAKKSSHRLDYLLSMDEKFWVRRMLAISTIALLALANGIYMLPCLENGKSCLNFLKNLSDSSYLLEPPVALPATTEAQNAECYFPAYLITFCSFFLFAITLLPQPGFWTKFIIVTVIIFTHGAAINLNPLRKALECSESKSFHGNDFLPEVWQLSAYLAAVLLVLASLARRLEKSARVLFLWKTEVEQQREHATQLRQKNEALVYNILPPHVAAHFLGARKRKHDELYSQSYLEVGILFASMPNFSDFYSEESVNNQGLECLRFLNEVISDFDSEGDDLKTRWSHLSLLVEFAFELKRTLTGINEQSFNHFVLKMGINQGPAVAGVIGVKKPHYDIWGDTVNVASRMESTGKAGYIQVTEKTQMILSAYGYTFEQRGLVNVKGKGQLMTYYLVGRGEGFLTVESEGILLGIFSNKNEAS